MHNQILSASAAVATAAFLALPNDASALSDLVLSVDCTNGQTVSRALSRPAVFDRRLVIVVQGTCTENVTIERDDVVLRAQTSGSGINAADPAKSAIDIISARRVELVDLSVASGRHGVRAIGGASVAIRGGAVRNAVRTGIYVLGGASALVDGSTIENHGGAGVQAEGGSITLTNSTVRANQFSGVTAFRGGQAKLGDIDDAGTVCCGNTIAENRLDGVTVADSASALLYGNVIERNGSTTRRWGILAVNESVANIRGGNEIRNNGSADGGGGVFARASTIRTGAGDAPLNPTTNEISGSFVGMLAELNASLDLRPGFSVTGNVLNGLTLNHGTRLRIEGTTISGNGQNGIFARGTSTVDVIGGANAVTANGAFGLLCIGNLTVYNGNNTGIVGNTVGDVSCTPY